MATLEQLDELFWAKVEKPADGDGCWLWTGFALNGYGRFGGSGWGWCANAHRWAYERLVGPIPQGLVLDHLCRVHSCVNPAHLEPVTNHENLMRGDTIPARNAAKTHCVNGHEFTPENTRLYTEPPPRNTTTRVCVKCRKETNTRTTIRNAEKRKAARAA